MNLESCINLKNNKANCKCTYSSCIRRGKCCECLRYHLRNNELPGCVFPPEAEKTYNRSLKYLISLNKNKNI